MGGAFGAVDADDVGAGVAEAACDGLGGFAEEGAVVASEGHGGDDRDVVVTEGAEGEFEFAQVREGLEDEEVDAAVEEEVGLGREGRGGGVGGEASEGCEAESERSDVAGDERRLGGGGDGLAGEVDAVAVDVGEEVLEAVASELEGVGAEGVGEDDFGAGVEVGAVDGEDAVGVGEVEVVEAGAEGDALVMEEGAHGAVGDDGGFAGFEPGEEVLAGHNLLRTMRAASIMLRREGMTSSHVRVLRPQSGLTQTRDGSRCLRKDSSLATMASTEGMAGLWMS